MEDKDLDAFIEDLDKMKKQMDKQFPEFKERYEKQYKGWQEFNKKKDDKIHFTTIGVTPWLLVQIFLLYYLFYNVTLILNKIFDSFGKVLLGN